MGRGAEGNGCDVLAVVRFFQSKAPIANILDAESRLIHRDGEVELDIAAAVEI